MESTLNFFYRVDSVTGSDFNGWHHYFYVKEMPRYRVARNRLATAVIHVNTYLTILGLIERELQNPDLDSNERIRLRSAYLEFQRLFYAGRSNGPLTVRRDLQICEGWEDTSE